MKTEEIQRQPRRQEVHALSRALQEQAPLSCQVGDSRGREVTLSSAGYVLRFGHSYRIWIIPPLPDEELQEVRIINRPDFLTPCPALKQVDQQGRPTYAIPFKVHFAWSAHLKKFGMDLRCDEVEIACYPRADSPREAVVYTCPIVVRPRWMIVLAAGLLGLLLLLLQQAVLVSLANQPVRDAVVNLAHNFASRGESWLWLVGVAAVLWLSANVVILARLYLRSRQLRSRYRELYPA